MAYEGKRYAGHRKHSEHTSHVDDCLKAGECSETGRQQFGEHIRGSDADRGAGEYEHAKGEQYGQSACQTGLFGNRGLNKIGIRNRDCLRKTEPQTSPNGAPFMNAEQSLRLLQHLVGPRFVITLPGLLGIIRIEGEILRLKIPLQIALPPPGVGRGRFPGVYPLIKAKVDSSRDAEPTCRPRSTEE